MTDSSISAAGFFGGGGLSPSPLRLHSVGFFFPCVCVLGLPFRELDFGFLVEIYTLRC
jgi:hypothetical protein